MKSSTNKDLREVFVYLQHFSELSELGKLVTSTKETAFSEYIDGFTDRGGKLKGYNKWTLLKLLALQLYVPLYTKIIGRRYAGFNFIDLFSGSGVGKLENTNIILPGSPIIGLAFATIPFKKAFFNDMSRLKISRLSKRINLLKTLSTDYTYREIILSDLSNVEVQTMVDDANNAVHDIFDQLEEEHKRLYRKIGKGLHNLIFIDPYGMEFHYESLKRILSSSIRNDIFILFNSYGAGLQAYDHIVLGKSARALYNHLGEDWLAYVKKRLEKDGLPLEKASRQKLSLILGEYYENLIRQGGRYIAIRISLPLELKNQQFDLIFATRKTSTGSKFIAAIKYIKELLERTEYKLINHLKDAIINKSLPGILNFMYENPEKLLKRYSLVKRYGIKDEKVSRHKGLDNWFNKKTK